jgi:hypothetical protein
LTYKTCCKNSFFIGSALTPLHNKVEDKSPTKRNMVGLSPEPLKEKIPGGQQPHFHRSGQRGLRPRQPCGFHRQKSVLAQLVLFSGVRMRKPFVRNIQQSKPSSMAYDVLAAAV